MIHTSIFLGLINLVLFLVIALIRQKNPFDLWVLFFLTLANVCEFFAAAVFTCADPTKAIGGLLGNLLPVIVVVVAIALPLLAISLLYRHTRSGS